MQIKICASYRILIWVWLTIGSILGLSVSGCSQHDDNDAQWPPSNITAAQINAHNRGVGLMGQYKYAEAHPLFALLARQYPNWPDAQVNLAIVTLNRQLDGDEQAALAIVDKVLQSNHNHLAAHFVAGLLRFYLGETAKAHKHFQMVAENDPDDAYAAYYLGQCMARATNHAAALKWYRHALVKDSYLRSAAYGEFMSLQRLKRRTEAQQALQLYKRLAANPRARLAEFKYTRMGAKAEVKAIQQPLPQQQQPAIKTVSASGFEAMRPLTIEPNSILAWDDAKRQRPISITPADIQGDGVVDLFIAGMTTTGAMQNVVLFGQDQHVFTVQKDHPFANIAAVNAALWGDLNNDGKIDVYFCRQGPNQLWQQQADGSWQDITTTSLTAGGDSNTIDGLIFDADHDGDLDIFLINADGPNELFNNNLDGSFRPLAEKQQLTGKQANSRAIVATDIDHDRDVDIIVINAKPPHDIFQNNRLWHYEATTAFSRFSNTAALTGIAADLDTDGFPEMYTATPDGELLRWQLNGHGEKEPQLIAKLPLQQNDWVQLALIDSDGDGQQELLVATPAQWQVLTPIGAVNGKISKFALQTQYQQQNSGIAPLFWDAATGNAIIGLVAGAGPALWQPSTSRLPFLALTLSGKDDKAQSMRSNASGIGAKLSLRIGSRWIILDTFRNQSGPGQGHQPFSFGVGNAQQADFVTIDWSDGVFQSELALQSGKQYAIAETERQLSSCPVLFTWDGSRYTFVTDLLGVGGLGYAVAPGEYAPPRPWENLLLPSGVLQPRNHTLHLKITEPMEEIAYLDAARLLTYDLPPGWQMVLDERMGIQDPQPTGQPLFFRHELLPNKATNDRNEILTDVIIKADGKAANVGELDHRFIGRLQNEHVLTLEFPHPVDAMAGQPLLLIDGWVEYPYSQTMFAAWQAGAAFNAPTVEARGQDGEWQTLLTEFGYPAGMPRRMSVGLPNLPVQTTSLRIRTNMEIYWDRIAIAYAETPPAMHKSKLTLKQAKLAKTGFPKNHTGPQRRPNYDYALRRPFWDTRFLEGLYTQLGPITELVNVTDDAVALIGPGEEVHLQFAAPKHSQPDDWSRYFVLETNGWAKDMDMFTQNGDTVGPLPTTAPDSERRKQLHARYHTRFQAGH